MKKKTIIFSIIFFVLDIISKLLIDHFISLYKSITIIKNFFYITKAYNNGVSFSMLSGHLIVIIITSIIVLVFLYFYQKHFKENNRNMIGFSMLYAGIIGNLFDRVVHGYVIDFLDFKIFSYDYPVFNLADIFISVGAILIIIAILKKEDVNEISGK